MTQRASAVITAAVTIHTPDPPRPAMGLSTCGTQPPAQLASCQRGQRGRPYQHLHGGPDEHKQSGVPEHRSTARIAHQEAEDADDESESGKEDDDNPVDRCQCLSVGRFGDRGDVRACDPSEKKLFLRQAGQSPSAPGTTSESQLGQSLSSSIRPTPRYEAHEVLTLAIELVPQDHSNLWLAIVNNSVRHTVKPKGFRVGCIK